MEALNNLEAVLCGPDGKCAISGSNEDRRIVDESLSAIRFELSRPCGEPVAWISHNVLTGKSYYGKLPITSLQTGVYKHTPLYGGAA